MESLPVVEALPIAFARPLEARVNRLLSIDTISCSVRTQLQAVLYALQDPKLHICVGLDKLHYCLTLWESKYLNQY